MKKNITMRLFAAILCLILVSGSAISCGKKDTDETESTTMEQTTTTTAIPTRRPTQATEAPEKPVELPPDNDGEFKITVKNGTADGRTTAMYDAGETATLTAATPANGYIFAHWEDSSGTVVGDTRTLTVTVSKEETYKAYYEVFFGNSAGTPIYADVEQDWVQGATDGKFTDWSIPNETRVTFKTPYLLKAGDTISVQLPRVQCCLQPGNCPNISNGGDCALTCAIIPLSKKANSETGDMTKDFTIETSRAFWSRSKFTALQDTYVIVAIKWEQHGTQKFLLSNDYMKQVKILLREKTTIENGTPIGGYWKAELDDGIQKIEAIREAAGGELSGFFFLTDSHWPDNAGFSPALINHLSEKLNNKNVVFGGDIIYRYNPVKQEAIDDEIRGFYDALSAYTKTGESLHIMTTLGNHDRNGSSNCPDKKLRLTEEEAYDIYFKRMEGWGVTVEGDPNRSYFDDVANKVRYIQFFFAGSKYGMIEDAYVDEAMAWAEEKINELDSEWTVVLFTHGVFSGAKGSEGELTPKSKEVMNRMLKLQAEADAEIAAWITGHIHSERNEVLVSADGNTKLRLISTLADALAYSSKMSAGNVTEQSFAFFQVDTVNKVVHLTRFGAGDDLTLPYGNAVEGTMTVPN